MKTFTKSIIAVVVALMIAAMMPVCASADGCGGGCSNKSLKGLEITGNTSVGAQLFHGNSVINSESHNCLGSTSSVTRQTFEGVGLMSSASGSICVTGKRMMGPGSVNGTGTFKSGMSGSISGDAYGIEGDVGFYTNSKVVLSGNNGCFRPCSGGNH